MNRPKKIGTAAETAVVNAIRAHGFPHAERAALAGTNDRGDLTGTPGVCWEVKGGNAARNASDGDITSWMAELDAEVGHARADIGVLVVQRKGVGPANAHRWWAVMHVNSWILGAAKHDFPVRMLLADACQLLRWAGYGQPLPEPAEAVASC